MPPFFPFAALVGLDQLKLALLLNAVNPAIGGVLIRGAKGTAKSSAARALRDLLPAIASVRGCPYHCDPSSIWPECPTCSTLADRAVSEMPAPFVDLPLGATEDRVIGTLDFERALRDGKRAFQPGLLAQAHRGILYIDEVNLLADHLVDVLLDAAAMGVNRVEREGVAVAHPARFLLIGTMNPEEGEVRPQLLDRFGLVVEAQSPSDADLRALVVRRRLEYESEPAGFAAAWHDEQQALRAKLASAQKLLSSVTMEPGLLTFISRLCCEMGVDGLRADLVLNKTARTLAAWHERMNVNLDDIRQAAELVLPHRSRKKSRSGLDQQRLDGLFNATAQTEGHSPPGGGEPEGNHIDDAEREQEVQNTTANPALMPFSGSVQVQAPHASALPGRRNDAKEQAAGRYVRASASKGAGVAVDATVRAAVCRSGGAGLDVRPVDLRHKVRDGKSGTLILFVVDASGSMAARRRMEAVKGAVLGLLRDAYEQRDRVGVVAFRGPAAQVLLEPTRSIDAADQALRALPTGGRTPLAHALALSGELLSRERRGTPTLLILLSDGRANVPLPDTQGDPWQQALDAAGRHAESGTPALVLDAETGFVRLGRAALLAQALRAECLALEALASDDLVLKIRQLI